MIKPTVGRVVWFFKNANQKEPLAAIITGVLGDRLIHLFMFDTDNNRGHMVKNVPLVQEGDDKPKREHAEWMPFQKGQAQAAQSPGAPSEEIGVLREEVAGLAQQLANLEAAMAAQPAEPERPETLEAPDNGDISGGEGDDAAEPDPNADAGPASGESEAPEGEANADQPEK